MSRVSPTTGTSTNNNKKKKQAQNQHINHPNNKQSNAAAELFNSLNDVSTEIQSKFQTFDDAFGELETWKNQFFMKQYNPAVKADFIICYSKMLRSKLSLSEPVDKLTQECESLTLNSTTIAGGLSNNHGYPVTPNNSHTRPTSNNVEYDPHPKSPSSQSSSAGSSRSQKGGGSASSSNARQSILKNQELLRASLRQIEILTAQLNKSKAEKRLSMWEFLIKKVVRYYQQNTKVVPKEYRIKKAKLTSFNQEEIDVAKRGHARTLKRAYYSLINLSSQYDDDY